MTDATNLPDGARAQLASQLAQRLHLVPETLKADGVLNVGEAFPVFRLRRVMPGEMQGRGSLDGLVEPAGFWHLQIRRGDTATLVTHAAEDTPRGWNIVNVTGAELAPLIQSAITWIDLHLPEAGSAQLLIVPARLCVAFWIRQPQSERIIIVSNDDPSLKLRTKRPYTVPHFVKQVTAAPSGPR